MARKSTKVPAWLLFDAALTEETVRTGFKFRTGRDPERTIKTGGGWLAGPVTPAEERRRQIAGARHEIVAGDDDLFEEAAE